MDETNEGGYRVQFDKYLMGVYDDTIILWRYRT